MIQKEQIKSFVIGVLAVGILAMAYYSFLGSPTNLTGKKATDVALAYINSTLLANGSVASLDGAVSSQSGLYKFKLKVGEQSFESFVTKDGKFLFPQVIEIKQSSTTASSTAQGSVDPAKACATLSPEKSETPQLEAFVVSQCPYGLQMQRVLTAIVANAPDLANNIKIKYIGSVVGGKITSMHGDEEAQENLRQICIREEQSTKFFPYLDCFIKEGKSSDCLKSTVVNETSLKTCMQGPGLEYAQKDFADAKKYSVGGSPTLILNGKTATETGFGGRSALALKELICCGFTTPISICSTAQLSNEQANAGLSKDYSGGSSTGGSCAPAQ